MSEIEELRRRIMEVLEYDPETGLFRWKIRRSNCKKGWFKGYVTKEGYAIIGFAGKLHKAHRLAWLISKGDFPEEDIDHENQDRSDNRIENLREANDALNMKNKSMYSRNKSGATGVTFHSRTGKWQADIYVNGRTIYLGLFSEIERAIAVRKAAQVEHGFHPNHGRKR